MVIGNSLFDMMSKLSLREKYPFTILFAGLGLMFEMLVFGLAIWFAMSIVGPNDEMMKMTEIAGRIIMYFGLPLTVIGSVIVIFQLKNDKYI